MTFQLSPQEIFSLRWEILIFAWALGVFTGLLLSRLQERQLSRPYDPPRILRRLWIAFGYWRRLNYDWRLAWLKAGHVIRGEYY